MQFAQRKISTWNSLDLPYPGALDEKRAKAGKFGREAISAYQGAIEPGQIDASGSKKQGVNIQIHMAISTLYRWPGSYR